MPKIQERHRQAYELRAAGKTFRQIASDMGVSLARARELVSQHEQNLKYQPGIERFLQSSGEEALDFSIYHLPLSTRSFNALRNADVRTVRDLIQRTEQELIKSKNFGHKSLLEIREVLAKVGLRLHGKPIKPKEPRKKKEVSCPRCGHHFDV